MSYLHLNKMDRTKMQCIYVVIDTGTSDKLFNINRTVAPINISSCRIVHVYVRVWI